MHGATISIHVDDWWRNALWPIIIVSSSGEVIDCVLDFNSISTQSKSRNIKNLGPLLLICVTCVGVVSVWMWMCWWQRSAELRSPCVCVFTTHTFAPGRETCFLLFWPRFEEWILKFKGLDTIESACADQIYGWGDVISTRGTCCEQLRRVVFVGMVVVTVYWLK